MKRALLISSFLLFSWTVLASGQRIGECPASTPRSLQKVKELRGVVIDENFARIQRVKVSLQVLDGKSFREIELAETDSIGRFNFEPRPNRSYRLVFTAPYFCTATIPVEYSKAGLKGLRVTLPVIPSDSCFSDCENKIKIEEVTGQEDRQ